MHAPRDAGMPRSRWGGPTARQLAAGLLVAGVVGLVCAAEAVACPNCKDAVNTADPEGLNLARGYFYSILIMLAMPLALVSSFGVYVWREMRRQERLAAEGGEGRPAVLPGGVHADPRSAAPPT